MNNSALTGTTTCSALETSSITAPSNQNVVIKNDDVSANIIVGNNGNIDLSGFNVNIAGDLNVTGTTTSFNTTQVEVEDPNLKLASNNTSDIFNIGFYAPYGLPDSSIVHTGVMRCKMSRDYVFFKEAPEPTNSTNLCALSKTGISCGNIKGSGNLTISNILQDTARDVYGMWQTPQTLNLPVFGGSRNLNEYFTAPSIPISPMLNYNTSEFVDGNNVSWLRVSDPGTYIIETSGTFVPDEKKEYEVQLYQNSAETGGSNVIIARASIVNMKGTGCAVSLKHIVEIGANFAVFSVWLDNKGQNFQWDIYDLKLTVHRIRKN